MKVKLEKEYKERYTLKDVERAKAVIKYEKEYDDDTAKGWAEYAVNEAVKGRNDYCRSILQADAETARNGRIWDAYDEGTGDMDVWIRFIAETADGFVKGGAYLSDIWQSGAVEYKQHMYIQYYRREE